MKVKRKHLELAAFIAVYMFALYLWTLPFQHNEMPYGEFDAISHWGLADFISQTDRTFVYLPKFIDERYGGDNSFKPHTLWYPPPFHTDFAIISSFAQGRFVPVYLTNAVFATAILISVFFVIRSLFGFLPAILSSFLLTFSMRDIMPYLWGQWPERFGYAFVPLTLYCFYRYYTTYSKESSKPIYLYLTSLLLGINLFIHPLTFFHSILGLFILFVFLWLKERKFPLDLKSILISIALFALLMSIFPYQSGNVIASFTQDSSSQDKVHSAFSRLAQWAPNAEDFIGSVPASYFSFREMNGLWTLPFLLFGILFLAIRRENRDIFLLAWLFSLYLILHRDLIGKISFLHRSLSATAHIFVPITVIGALSIPKLIPVNKDIKKYLIYAFSILIVVLAFMYSFPAANSTLKAAYEHPFVRVNQDEIEATAWIESNIPEDGVISLIGPPDEKKFRWLAFLSHRPFSNIVEYLTLEQYSENAQELFSKELHENYVMLDYTDIGRLQDRSHAERWLQFERIELADFTLLYDKNNIRIYKYETPN
ncbi:hypothetical protein HYU09_04860 [Candidatus Woesearchaeota archaeon]|nr:hypothetical protein [Candidatus Woesearchaeota archaeon]